MGDKGDFPQRLKALNLDVNALEEVRVHVPVLDQGTVVGNKPHIIPNVEGKRGSLAVYAAITTNDGHIGVEQARRGLDIFGAELINDARANFGTHPNIDLLEAIVANGDKLRADVIRRNSAKPVPFSREIIEEAVQRFGTPIHLYDEVGIRQVARNLKSAFSWVPGVGGFGFRNHFAVKAAPNPSLLKLLHEEGMGADCSSFTELMIAQRVGLDGGEIMFTSNDTPAKEFTYANRLGAVVNFDDLTHIDFFSKHVGSLPELVCCRYNPGELKRGNEIIGRPEEAKYGFTREQLSEGFRKLRDSGVRRFGLHTMVASNELDPEYFVDTARILFETVLALSRELDIEFDFVNLGGGIGTPYKPEQRAVDLQRVSDGIREEYRRVIENEGLAPLRVVMENGRMVTGPNGFLVSKVLHVAKKHRDYVGLDACMANLMRPALYGAYHHLTVLGKEDAPLDHVYDVTGGLCENNDKFAINRPLPKIEGGDLVVIHNAGAHGHAMGFNYNGKLRSAEVLVQQDRTLRQIRRAETPQDYFSTLDFGGAEFGDLAK